MKFQFMNDCDAYSFLAIHIHTLNIVLVFYLGTFSSDASILSKVGCLRQGQAQPSQLLLVRGSVQQPFHSTQPNLP